LRSHVNTGGIDVLTALPSYVVLQYMSNLVDLDQAKDKNYVVSLTLNEDNYELELAKGLLRYKEDYSSGRATSTVEIDNVSLFAILTGKAKFGDLVSSGQVKATGNPADFENIIGTLNTNQGNQFNLILPNN
jgi:alkyl sulfatase BDS1-like metallo-beta-lactamase superfamily hydrolase